MGGCGCAPAPRVQRLTLPRFGPDNKEYWGKIPKTFGARFVCIGPESEWDSCTLDGVGGTKVVVSVGSPCMLPIDTDVIIRPHRSFGNASTELPIGQLDLLVFDAVPHVYPGKRAPRLYPQFSNPLTTTESFCKLQTFKNLQTGAVVGVQTNVVIAGARSISLYLVNGSGIDISWRLVGSRENTTQLFPISPSGYAAATPTYNTLTAGHEEAWHLDVSTDAHEQLYLAAKSASGTPSLVVALEVQD